jgi:uncharacterized protein (DUF1330 family)
VGVYVIAQLRFTDEARYRKYQASFPEVFASSGGRVLAADEAPTLLEGEWSGNKVVLLEFPDEERAVAFLRGREYERISEDRRAGADTVALLVRALEP